MNLLKHLTPYRGYWAPAGDDGAAGGGGTADRGDDFTPTDDTPASGTQTEQAAEGKDAAGKEGEGQDGKEGDKSGEDKPRKGKGIIPVDRHEAILARERERRESAERELRRFQGGERVAQTNAALNNIDQRVAAMEEEYSKLLTDGEHAKASAKMREIRALERERNQRESDVRIAEATARATEAARFELARERLEAAYPELNPDSGEFDEERAETVVDLMQAYQMRHGMTPTEAMQKAARRVLGVEGSRQAAATTVKPRVDAGKAETDGKDPGAQRQQAAIDKALETARRQPPELSKTGLDSDKAGKVNTSKDVSKMSFAEFSKLSDDELAKLRGDVMTA